MTIDWPKFKQLVDGVLSKDKHKFLRRLNELKRNLSNESQSKVSATHLDTNMAKLEHWLSQVTASMRKSSPERHSFPRQFISLRCP